MWRNSLNIVGLLIEKYPELIDDTDDKNQLSAAGKAFNCGRVEILKFLLEKGARVTSEANVRINILKCSGPETTDEIVEAVINFCVEDRRLEEVCLYGDSLKFSDPVQTGC